MKLRAFLPIGLTALAALALAQGIVLKWTPKVGDKSTYSISGTVQAGGADVTIKGTSTEEITKVDTDTVTTAATSKLTINVLGTDQDMPSQTITQIEKLDGTPVDLQGGPTDAEAKSTAARLMNINMLLLPSKPLAVGDTWTAEAKKDEKKDLPGYKIDYKLEGEEKVGAIDTYKITATGGETEGEAPTKVKATYWLDKSNARAVRRLVQLTDVVFAPGVPAASGTLDYVLQP